MMCFSLTNFQPRDVRRNEYGSQLFEVLTDGHIGCASDCARRFFGANCRMKKIILSLAVALAAPFAWSQVSETTTTTTDAGGTITTFTPGSSIVLRESTGPKTYRFGKTVTYVTRSGKTLDEDAVRTRIKVGVPVHVHYVGEGDNMLVDRVVLDED